MEESAGSLFRSSTSFNEDKGATTHIEGRGLWQKLSAAVIVWRGDRTIRVIKHANSLKSNRGKRPILKMGGTQAQERGILPNMKPTSLWVDQEAKRGAAKEQKYKEPSLSLEDNGGVGKQLFTKRRMPKGKGRSSPLYENSKGHAKGHGLPSSMN